MENLKVIFRKDKDGEIIAFLPEIKVRHGNIMSYMHIGQHGEASYDYYVQDTNKAAPKEYKVLLDELNGIYSDCKLIVKQKLHYNDLIKAWK